MTTSDTDWSKISQVDEHELQERVQHSEEVDSEYQNGSDHQRQTAEKESPSGGVGEQEEVRHVETEDETAVESSSSDEVREQEEGGHAQETENETAVESSSSDEVREQEEGGHAQETENETAVESSSSDGVREQEEGGHAQETENEQATLAEVCAERDLLKLEYESLSNELMEKSSEVKDLMIQLDEERDDNEELSNILRSVAQPKVVDTEQEEGVEQDGKATRVKLTTEEKRELQEKIWQLHEMLSEYQNGADHHRPTVEEKSPSDGVGEQEEVRHVETEDEQATLAEVCSERDKLKEEKESLSYQLLVKSSRINELEMDLFDRTNEIEELKASAKSQRPNKSLDTAKKLDDMELKVTRNEQMVLDLSKSVDAMAEELAPSTLPEAWVERDQLKEEEESLSGQFDEKLQFSEELENGYYDWQNHDKDRSVLLETQQQEELEREKVLSTPKSAANVPDKEQMATEFTNNCNSLTETPTTVAEDLSSDGVSELQEEERHVKETEYETVAEDLSSDGVSELREEERHVEETDDKTAAEDPSSDGVSEVREEERHDEETEYETAEESSSSDGVGEEEEERHIQETKDETVAEDLSSDGVSELREEERHVEETDDKTVAEDLSSDGVSELREEERHVEETEYETVAEDLSSDGVSELREEERHVEETDDKTAAEDPSSDGVSEVREEERHVEETEYETGEESSSSDGVGEEEEERHIQETEDEGGAVQKRQGRPLTQLRRVAMLLRCLMLYVARHQVVARRIIRGTEVSDEDDELEVAEDVLCRSKVMTVYLARTRVTHTSTRASKC